jgi:hypothetical protein
VAPTTINLKLKRQSAAAAAAAAAVVAAADCGGRGNSNSDSGGGNGDSNGRGGGIGSKGNSIVICRTTAAMRGKHNNQPKEGRAAKMPVTNASNRQKAASVTKG